VFFSAFVLMQFWNLFNVRYYRTERSILSDLVESASGKRRLSDCFSRGFLLIAGIILLGQVLIVNLAGDFFEVAPLSARDWVQIFLITSPVLLIPDLLRSIRHWGKNRTARRSTPRR
jgi:Ca2+-transporting ATPase